MSGIEDTAQIPSVQQPKSGLPEGVDEFLASVDLPAVNPPPNWTGFTIKKYRSGGKAIRICTSVSVFLPGIEYILNKNPSER